MNTNLTEIFHELLDIENISNGHNKILSNNKLIDIDSIEKQKNNLAVEYNKGFEAGVLHNKEELELKYKIKIENINKHIDNRIKDINTLININFNRYTKKMSNIISKIIYLNLIKINSIEKINNEINDIFSCIKNEEMRVSISSHSDKETNNLLSFEYLQNFKFCLDKEKSEGDYDIEWSNGSVNRKFSQNLNNIINKYIDK